MADTQGMRYGKTSPAHSVQETRAGATFEPCLKRSQKPKFQLLHLESGQTPEWCEATALISLGACTTPNISECHSDAGESFLSAILEADAPAKYYLSPKACQGILRRAQARGKELPPVLKEALEAQAYPGT